nr:MAG TPA: hypothetical protein [Caudoviricetes sp.]
MQSKNIAFSKQYFRHFIQAVNSLILNFMSRKKTYVMFYDYKIIFLRTKCS